MIEELKAIVGQDEQIMYEGKPNKKCFIFTSEREYLWPDGRRYSRSEVLFLLIIALLRTLV